MSFPTNSFFKFLGKPKKMESFIYYHDKLRYGDKI